MESEKPIHENNPERHADTTTNKNSQAAPQLPPSTRVSKPDIPPTPHSYQITCKTEKDWRDKIKFWAELVVGLFVIVYTVVSTGLWITARKQLDLSERAWIGILPTGTVYEPVTYPKGVNKPVFRLQYTLKNVGHSAAFVEVIGEIFDPRLGAWRDVQKEFCQTAFDRAKPAGREWGKDAFTILPGDQLPYEVSYAGYDANAKPLEIDGPRTIVPKNIGCILYRSVADDEVRMTTFVADISMAAGKSGAAKAITLDGRDIPPDKLRVLNMRVAGYIY